MNILLVRPKNPSSLGVLKFVNVEPLELEYLASICLEEGGEYEIYDGSIEKRKFRNKFSEFSFDAVVFSGYINSINTIKEYAKYIKGKNKNTVVIVGGVVAEVVPELLYSLDIDIIVHSGGFEPFRKLLQCGFDYNSYKGMEGICYREGGSFIKNDRNIFDIKSLTLPDRSHFYANSNKFRYLNYRPVAIMKTSYSCPYKCNFCYCRKLNGGNFVFMDMENILSEIKGIHCGTIWIVDDIFLLDRERVLSFVEGIEREGILKNFIVYSRADFIVNNEDLLPLLKKIGIVMAIVGLEAINDENLKGYNKMTDKDMNKKCVELLQGSGIECTGLFIAGIDYKKEDFKNLRRWIKESSLSTYTVSIFTPLLGTEAYEKYKAQMTTGNYSRYDFLHLIINPIYMGRKTFYYEFFKLHIPYIQSFLKEKILKLKKILGLG